LLLGYFISLCFIPVWLNSENPNYILPETNTAKYNNLPPSTYVSSEQIFNNTLFNVELSVLLKTGLTTSSSAFKIMVTKDNGIHGLFYTVYLSKLTYTYVVFLQGPAKDLQQRTHMLYYARYDRFEISFFSFQIISLNLKLSACWWNRQQNVKNSF